MPATVLNLRPGRAERLPLAWPSMAVPPRAGAAVSATTAAIGDIVSRQPAAAAVYLYPQPRQLAGRGLATADVPQVVNLKRRYSGRDASLRSSRCGDRTSAGSPDRALVRGPASDTVAAMQGHARPAREPPHRRLFLGQITALMRPGPPRPCALLCSGAPLQPRVRTPPQSAGRCCRLRHHCTNWSR